MNTFIKMLRDESGASAAEYALILALVGTGIAIAAWNLGNQITGTLTASAECIEGVEEAVADSDAATPGDQPLPDRC